MATITLTTEQTETYDAGDERAARDMLRSIVAQARALHAETGEPVTIETADGVTIEVIDSDPASTGDEHPNGTASVGDAIDMMIAGGVDLAGELTSIGAAYLDICAELESAGYDASFAFSEDDLREAIEAEIAKRREG